MAFACPGLMSNQMTEEKIITSYFLVRSKPYKLENSTNSSYTAWVFSFTAFVYSQKMNQSDTGISDIDQSPTGIFAE